MKNKMKINPRIIEDNLEVLDKIKVHEIVINNSTRNFKKCKVKLKDILN